MSARLSWPGRLICLLILAAFLGVTEGEALGIEPCPYHDALPGAHLQSGAEHPAPEGTSVHSHAEPDASAGHPSHPAGPCTCLDDCHVGTSSAAALSDASLLSATSLPRLESRALWSDRSLQGPRHHLFELHLPNAPPVTS